MGQVCRIVRERTQHEKKTTEIAYCVTSLTAERAGPEQLLALARRHWGAIENGLHWVRDETFGEDRSTIAGGHAPQNLAALRNTGISWLRHQKTDNIAATLRSFTRNPLRLFRKLGYPN